MIANAEPTTPVWPFASATKFPSFQKAVKSFLVRNDPNVDYYFIAFFESLVNGRVNPEPKTTNVYTPPAGWETKDTDEETEAITVITRNGQDTTPQLLELLSALISGGRGIAVSTGGQKIYFSTIKVVEGFALLSNARLDLSAYTGKSIVLLRALILWMDANLTADLFSNIVNLAVLALRVTREGSGVLDAYAAALKITPLTAMVARIDEIQASSDTSDSMVHLSLVIKTVVFAGMDVSSKYDLIASYRSNGITGSILDRLLSSLNVPAPIHADKFMYVQPSGEEFVRTTLSQLPEGSVVAFGSTVAPGGALRSILLNSTFSVPLLKPDTVLYRKNKKSGLVKVGSLSDASMSGVDGKIVRNCAAPSLAPVISTTVTAPKINLKRKFDDQL